jgi:hypothetical protein
VVRPTSIGLQSSNDNFLDSLWYNLRKISRRKLKTNYTRIALASLLGS